MVVICLRGGLGNQMFQYAFAYIFSEQRGDSLRISTFFQKREEIDRGVRLQHLSCGDLKILPCKIDVRFSYKQKIKGVVIDRIFCKRQKYRGLRSFDILSKYGMIITHDIYKYYGYPSITCGKDVGIDGYFQSGKYLKGYEKEIRRMYKVPDFEFELNKNEELEKQIQNSNSVCLHIRRGDYASDRWSQALLICDRNYYVQAIEYILSKVDNPVFYVFSNSHDDIKWIKQNYKLESQYKVIYVDKGNNDVQDLRLMYNCKNFILSNSSYSWWAQFLCENGKKIVVAPNKWTNENQDFSDVYEDWWKQIEIGEIK